MLGNLLRLARGGGAHTRPQPPRRPAVRATSRPLPTESAEILLGGRVYVPIGPSTAAHDFFAISLVRKAGLDALHMQSGEDAEAFVRRIVDEVIDREQLFTLLGCIVAPQESAGALWTRESCDETAQHLASLTDEADKEGLRAIVSGLVLHFLASEVVFLTTSPSYSAEGPESSTPLSSGTASGAALSATLPGTISTAPSTSSGAGLSARS